jgi:hypothetical protein
VNLSEIVQKSFQNLFRKPFRICSEKLSEFVQKSFQNLFRKAFRICSEKLSEFVHKSFQKDALIITLKKASRKAL